jgi:hypothetical protein
MHVDTTRALKHGGPPADGGHSGGRRTGGHPGGRRTGGRYTADGHARLRCGGKEDTEGAPTRRQGTCINKGREMTEGGGGGARLGNWGTQNSR